MLFRSDDDDFDNGDDDDDGDNDYGDDDGDVNDEEEMTMIVSILFTLNKLYKSIMLLNGKIRIKKALVLSVYLM